MFGNELLDFIASHPGDGRTIALAVQQLFGGDAPYIPKRRKYDETQEFIEKNFGQMSTRQLARSTGLSVRAVQDRLNRPVSKKQTSLF